MVASVAQTIYDCQTFFENFVYAIPKCSPTSNDLIPEGATTLPRRRYKCCKPYNNTQHPLTHTSGTDGAWCRSQPAPGTTHPGWNIKENAIKCQTDLPHGYGIGLAHAYSGTMALDIDDWATTTILLAEHNIDLRALYDAPDAVVIESGNPGHGKLLYSMPFGAALPSKKIMHDGATVYELRCATTGGLTVQDVLPPSIHPETKQPYRWAGAGNWTRLPVIPQALLDLWSGMLALDKERTIPTGDPIDASWDEIAQAVAAIPADCSRDEWVAVGMALQWVGTQTGQTRTGLADVERMVIDRSVQVRRGNGKSWHSGNRSGPTKRQPLRWGHSSTSPKLRLDRPLPDASMLFDRVDVPTMDPIDVIDGLRQKPPGCTLICGPPSCVNGRARSAKV